MLSIIRLATKYPYNYPIATLKVTVLVIYPLKLLGVISYNKVTQHGAKNPTNIPSNALIKSNSSIFVDNIVAKQTSTVKALLTINGFLLPNLSVNYPDTNEPIRKPTKTKLI